MNQPASGHVRYRTKNDRLATAARWVILAAVVAFGLLYYGVGL